MKNILLYVIIFTSNFTVSAAPSSLGPKNKIAETIAYQKMIKISNECNSILTDTLPPKSNQIPKNYEGFYDIFYISGTDTIKTSFGDKATWVYTDTIEITPSLISGRLFETVFINKQTNQKEVCGFVQNYVKVNNVVREIFDNNTMVPALTLNENDTVRFDYICCPAECTEGLIYRISSAVMIVKANITTINTFALGNQIQFDPILKTISSKSLIENGTLINLQGKLMSQFNTQKYFSLGTLPSGNYIFTGIVAGKPIKKMIYLKD